MMLSLIIIVVLIVVICDKNRIIREFQVKVKKLENQVDILLKRVQNADKIEENIAPSAMQQEIVREDNYLTTEEVHEEKEQYDIFAKTDTISNKEFDENWNKINSIVDNKMNEKEKRQLKNTVLLALGAFFIVVAAISFLYSTWYTVPDFLKTGVILVLAGVFLGISHVADKVFDLKKTASTFFYIAMAYIPICLVSISLFGFIGEYLSFTGEGKFVYLSFASLLVAAVYLIFGYKNKDEKLYYASKFMQFIFVVCLASIITIKALNILCAVLAYTIILNIVDNRFEKEFLMQGKLFNKLSVCIISYISILCSLFAFDGAIVEILLMLGALINAIVLYLKENQKVFFGIAYVLGFLLLLETFLCSKFGFKFMHYQIATLVMLFITTFYYNFIEKEQLIRKIVNWTNLIIMSSIYLFSLTSFSSLDLYILGALGNLIAFTVYIKNNKEQYGLFCITTIISSIFLLLPDVKHVNAMVTLPFYEVSFAGYLIGMISAITMFVLLFNDKNKYLKIIPLSILFINLYRYQWVIGEKIDITFYLAALFTVFFTYLSLKDTKDIIYRTASYVFLISWFIYGGVDLYLATLIMIVFGIVQAVFAEQNIKNVINTITTLSLLVMYVYMIEDLLNIEVESYILSIVASLAYWYAFSRTKYIKVLPMLGLIIPLFNYDIMINETSNLSFILNVITVFFFLHMSFTHRAKDEYKIVSFAYVIALIFKYNDVIDFFTATFIVIIWSLIQMLIASKNAKEVLKGLILTSVVIMYVGIYIQAITNDITTKSYALTIISSLICWGLISKTKYLKALPMLGLIIPLFNYDLTLMGQYDITFIVNLAIVGLFTYMSIVGKKDNVYKAVSFIYLLALFLKYNEIDMYIKHFMLIIWGVCELLYSEGKLKDIFKALIATVSLSMYINALNDLEMIEITAFLLVGFLAYTHVITRMILSKYSDDYKVLEYFATAIIYLVAFGLYKDGIDLAIFIAAQILILMIAYVKKFGPVFAVTVPTVVINTFYVTREFWFAIPWWAYLIVVGGILIVFAARNELSEKQDINTIKEKLNKVKNYLDM